MKRSSSLLRSPKRQRPLIEPLEARIAPAANAWIGAVSGNWNTPGNWSDGVPTADDVVTINPAGTLTITIDAGVQVVTSLSMPGDDALAISGGSLAISSASVLHNLALGGGSLFANGTVSLTGAGSFSGAAILGGSSVVTNNGALGITGGEPNLQTELVNANGATISHGNAFLDLDGAAGKLRVVSGGLYESVNTASGFGLRALGGTTGFFVETGGVFRHASPNAATFDVAATVPFNVNGGTVQNTGVAGTALNLGGVGTFTNATLSPSANTTINFGGNNNTVVGTIGGSGAGVVNLAGGRLHATAAGAALNFPAGLFNWSGSGVLSGPGVFTNAGTIQITGGEPDLATELVNTGTIKHGNAFLDLDGAGAKLRLVSGGLYESVNTASGFGFRALNGTPGVFVEAGGVFRHASPNAATFEVAATVPFSVNGGTLQNTGAAGTALNLGGIGTFTNASLSPSVGTTINFAGTNNTVVGTITGSGAGVVNLAGGQLHADAAGATLNFPAGLFNFSGSGVLSGPGVFTNTGTIQITGGEPDLATELVNAGTIRQSSAFLDLDGAASKLSVIAGGLYESVNTASGFGLRAANNPAGFFVEAGGVFRHASPNAATFNLAATVPFHVHGGTLQNTGAAGTALNLGGVGTFTNATFMPALGTTINFAGDNNTIIGTLSGSGAGVVTVSSGKLHADAAGAMLNFPGNIFNWGGSGTLSGPGKFTNAGTLNINFGEPNLETELVNAGTIKHGNAFLDLDGATAKVRVVSGGLYESVNTASGFGVRALNGPAGIFVEAGATFRHNTANSATFDFAAAVPFSNLGKVEVALGALNFNGPLAQKSGANNAATLTGGAWEVAGGGTLNLGITGLATNAATIIVRGSGSFTGLGALATNSGSLSLLEGADLTITTANFRNDGALTLSAGSVLTAPAFTQSLTGSTTFELGGTAAAQIGRLAVTGAATFAGTANFQIVNAFTPAAGQSLVPATFGSKVGNFATITGLGLGRSTIFEVVNSPMALTLNSLVNAADLSTQSVATPVNTNAGANIALSYTVQNVSANPTLATTWTDTVYLSLDGTLDSSDLVLTKVTHSGAVAGGGSYTENVNVPLIGALPANYKILVVADGQGRVPDPARANNFAASAGTFALEIPVLTPGAAFNGTIQSGQDLYFRIALPAGQSPTFTFTGAVAGEAEIYESIDGVPTRANFFESAFTASSTVQRITGDTTGAATYYVLVHGRENAGAGQAFSLFANGTGFDLAGTSVAGGPNIGNVTTTLSGTQFSTATTFSLVSGGTTRAAATYFRDGRNVDATFDLTGLAAGSYNIVANNGGPTDTLTNAFAVTNGGTVGALNFSVSAPRYIRAPFTGVTATITYENVGGTDLAAPLFNVIAENARLRLADEGYLAGTFTQANGSALGVFELLGVSGGLAGVLSPGEKATIDVIFEPVNSAALALVNFNVLVAGNSSAPINFDGLKADLQPVGVANEAWDAVFANFKTAAGTTVGSYRAMLVDNANYLGQFGKVSSAATRLVDFELDQAGALGAIADRYELGAFGRGSGSPFGERLTASTSGDVTLKDGSEERIFTKLANGSYQGTGLDFGKLTKSAAGVFTLDSGNGVKTAFRVVDGRIDFLQDANGQRVTATWNTSGQLTSATDALTGDVARFTYNAKGRIATETDAVGRVTSYGYDASGEHLTTKTDALGTTNYNYVTGQGAAREHALASVTGPDGVPTTFAYDVQGRVMQTTTGTGPLAITHSFAYDSAGKVTITDSAGHVTQSYYVAQGAIARTTDALGQMTSATFDTLGRVVSVTEANGVKSSTNIGGTGLSYGIVDAGRAKTQIEVGGDIRRLQSVLDPGGDLTRFNYDAKGNLLETLYPDGGAVRNEYDAAGRVTAATDANGGRTTFTYDAHGLVTHRELPDGTDADYTYDARRNLLTATDASGTTTLTYDAADRLTSIEYPNGKTITMTYDAAGRRATVADQTGYTVRYSYDAFGRIDEVRDTANALLVNYDYNALGQLTAETRANGSTSAYTYDALGRTGTITHRAANNAITGFFNYTYDTQDRVKTVTDTTGTTTYTYDLTGQLIGAALPGGRTISYGYDAEGNRVTVADSVAGTKNFTTNNADQYTTAGGETLAYDQAGRVIASTVGGITTSFTYDSTGRLAGVVAPGSVITYHYDALNNRIGKTENGVRTDFANDPAGLGTVFGEYSGTTATAHFASGLGIAARTDGAGANAFYHYDATGNTALLSGAGGTSVASYTYLPFGEIAAQTGSIAQPFTFNGALGVQDETGDLYSMRARTYDAGLGRFTSRDPLGFNGGDTNLYSFVANNPINHADPSGLAPGSLVTLPALPGGLPLEYVIPTAPALPGGLSLPFGANTAALPAGATVTELGVTGEALYLPAVKLAGGDKSGLLIKGSEAAIKAFGSPAQKLALAGSKLLTPVAKALNKLVPPPVQVLLAAKDVYDIEKSAYDYYKDAGEYGKFNPDEKHFSPEYLKKNGDDFLFNQLIKDGIAGGKSKQEATLDAISFIKKLNNDFIRDQQNNGGGSTTTTNTVTTQVVRPSDPNNLIGPAGAGADAVPAIIAPGQTRFDGFVKDDADFGYKIEFENQPSASAPAQVVTVTQTLDGDLDFSTFAFKSFGFGAFNVPVPAGAIGTSFHTIYDATAALGVLVKIDAELNTQTGLLTVTYTSLDPATNDVPLDPFTGFLPPDDASGRGDGFLTYTVAPKTGLANGTAFTGTASIVFDTEDAIATPTVTNKLDTDAPTSSVTAFPGATASRPTFVVRWTGVDDLGGSGLAGITLSYTDNGGPLQTATAANADGGFRFPGVVGHTYAFYSQAVDNVGNTSALPASPERSITVVAPTYVNVGASKTFVDADGDRYTIRKTGPGAVKVALLDPDGDGRGSIDFLQVDGSTIATSLSITVVKSASGNGRVDIGDVTVNGALKSFVARQSELVVNGFTATRAVGAIAVGSVLQPDALLADPMIKVGGAASSALSVSALIVADGFHLQTPGRLASLVARSIGDGTISARSIGTLKTNAGDLAADITSLIGIGNISVAGGDLSGHLTARSFGPISIARGDFGGEINSLTAATALGTTPALTSLAITGGDFTGDLRVLGSTGAITVSALRGIGGNMTDASINAARIASLTVGRNITSSTVLAGADLGADHALGGTGFDVDTFGRGAIGAVAVGGNVTASLLAAGLNPGNAIAGDSDDSIFGATNAEKLASRIASLVVRGGDITGSYFAAGSFTTRPRIGTSTIVLPHAQFRTA